MIKKIIICIFFALLINPVTAVNTLGFASEKNDIHEEITVKLNNLKVDFDQPPILREGRVLVPFRAIAETLGVEVHWNGETREVHASDEETGITLAIGDYEALINGEKFKLDEAPLIKEGRTLIPLRFFSEAFGCKVNWEQEEYEVSIYTPPSDLWISGFYALGSRQASSWEDLFIKEYPQREPGRTVLVDELALGWYSIDEEGHLLTRSRTGWQRPSGWEYVLEAAQDYGLYSEMVVHVTDYVSEDEMNGTPAELPHKEDLEEEAIKEKEGAISSLLSSPQAMEKGAREIAAEAEKYYQGVNLNFEGLGLTERGEELKEVQDSFTRFVQKVKKELKRREESLTLTLTLHAPNSVFKGYDYASLGEVSDSIIIMAYDYEQGPEPVSKVTEAVNMALNEGVPPEKLLLGISIPSETSKTLPAKIEIARRHELRGAGLWRLGLLREDNWEILQGMIIPRELPE